MTHEIGRIAVYVSGSGSAPAAIEAAARMADTFSASLMGIHVVDNVPAVAIAPMPGAAMNPVMIDDLEQQAKERAEIAEEQFKAVMKKAGRDGHWLCIDDPTHSSREQTNRVMHLADFVVLEHGDPEHRDVNGAGRVGDAVVESGRPVILHPHSWSGSIGESSVLVAWKPTGEAARAVHDSLPFLARAERVTVTAVTDREASPPDEAEPGQPLVDYLAERGIAAESRPLFGIDDSDTAGALMDQASRLGADLLVMGAYSHSRLRERLFGGVTREVLERAKIPALLSH